MTVKTTFNVSGRRIAEEVRRYTANPQRGAE